MSGDLRSTRFRRERERDWLRLEDVLGRLERGSLKTLTDAELLALPGLYRAALSSLSVARATSLDHGLVEYLEALSTRAYFLVYGTRTGLGQRIGRFFAQDWPAAAQALWRETAVSWAVAIMGAVLAAWLVTSDPDWYYVFVPEGLADGRTPSAATEYLRRGLYDQGSLGSYGTLSAMLMTHNAQIAILAFALGFAFCVPTAVLMAYNGATLGAFVALYASRGLGWEVGAWLAVHGATELTAVVLAGAAGLRIGTAVALPGRLTRMASAARAGRQAATLVAGCAVMLGVAGVLEGLVRQVVVDPWQRALIGVVTLLFWVGYLYGRRREAAP